MELTAQNLSLFNAGGNAGAQAYPVQRLKPRQLWAQSRPPTTQLRVRAGGLRAVKRREFIRRGHRAYPDWRLKPRLLRARSRPPATQLRVRAGGLRAVKRREFIRRGH